jgi:hypothetical protein
MSRAQRDIWNTAITWFLYTSEDRADKGLSPAFDSTLAEAEALRRYPDSPCKNVREIVVEWLLDNGCEGFENRDKTCSCSLAEGDDMMCFKVLDCSPWNIPGVLVDGKIVERT